MTWSTITVSNDYWNLQSIGFLDSQYGISGGETLFETFDGGKNWKERTLGTNYNRFFMIDKNTAFLSGRQIYKLERK